MYLKSIGTEVARREYEDDKGAKILVVLGKPSSLKPDDSFGSFVGCPFQIKGIGDDGIMFSAGIDDFSAIMGALAMIAARLKSSTAAINGGLRWPGDPKGSGSIGFP